MKRNTRKGFTGIELVIVIAIIAILAASLIPTFGGLFQGANKTADTQLIRNLNTALLSDPTGVDTMTEALALAEEYGFDVQKINAKALNNEILWDEENNVFCYLNDGKIEYSIEQHEELTNKLNYWVISDEIHDTYSTYYIGTETEIETTKGFDAGKSGVTEVTYTNDGAAQVATVRTNGGTLIINAPADSVLHYGEADVVKVEKVASASYHEFGKVGFVQIAEGRFVAEASAKINTIIATTDAAEVVNNGTIGATYAPENIPAEGAEEFIAALQQGATLFAGGTGTKEDPYLIENAKHLMNISENYGTYKYYKVADGVTSIDMTGVGNIKLHGSFDGNGVKLVNLNTALFQQVGYQNTKEDIKISNIEATMNATDGRAFVRCIFNSGKTTFENVKLHGYIEGLYNLGSFYNYGTANLGGSDGCDYTVEFINSTSDITLVCTSGNGIGGMIGHGYEGTGNTLTIIRDSVSVYTGKMYTTNGSTCDSLMYMASNATKFILNGVETSGYDKSFDYPSSKLTVVNPENNGNGVYLEKADGANKVVISVTTQYFCYDAQGNKIANESGLTAVVGSFELTELADTIKILDAVSSVEIVNEYVNGAMGYTLENGVLKVFVGPRNALSGNVGVQAVQYNANGDILTVGTATLGTITK